MKPTILDVAKLANVSKATVSRVLNNNPKVNHEIRKRVVDAIEELGYRPSAIARNLANSTSNMIGLILPDITNPFFPLLARGIEDASHRLGYTVFISNTDNDPKIEQEYIHKMVQQQVGGVILIASTLEEEKVNDLIQLQTPFVLCDRFISNTPFDSVSIDHYKAAFEVVSYFIEQGHERIAHIAGPSMVQSSDTRREAYLDAMKEAGLSPCIRSGSFSYETGFTQMNEIVEEYRPSAVFAANDLIAFGAINAVQCRGLKVPENVAFIGCDDILFAQMCTPPLSTISLPAYRIGVTAVELLNDRIKGVRKEAKQVILEHQFVKRQSCVGGTSHYEL